MKHEKFTTYEHLAAGEIIRRIRRDLHLLLLANDTAYGNKVGNHIKKAVKAVEGVKNELDNFVCKEFPNSVTQVEGIPIVSIYYGKRVDIPDAEKGRTASDAREELRRLAGLKEGSSEERRPGRPRTVDAEKLENARRLLDETKLGVEEIARRLGLASSTLYRYLQSA